MEKSKTDRINELAAKKKVFGLTPEEEKEQYALRREYIDEFKGNLKSQLESIRVIDEDGNRLTAREYNRTLKEDKKQR